MISNVKCSCKFLFVDENKLSIVVVRSYRQAQAAVLQAIPRLKAERVATKRPDDYYAQMVKSDEHMKKVETFNSYGSHDSRFDCSSCSDSRVSCQS
jgi:hypothetical protein